MKPKIKVRMPKWQNIKSQNWAKELLMTFIGTTLSIILTFGTAEYLEQKQNRADGRQAAMMVIHDMENTAEDFKVMEKEEERYFNCALYVLEHRNEIDSMSADTLKLFTQYLVAGGTQYYNYDASSETLFLSSQDVWKNINNASFIDAVQEFFSYRRVLYESLNRDGMYIRPVSNEEYYSMLLSGNDVQESAKTFGKNFAKKYVTSGRVQSFINYSFTRRQRFSGFAESFRAMANRCKFMMDISDSELKDYIASRQRSGKPVKERELVGRWLVESTSTYHVEREFFKDHTYTNTITNYIAYAYYTGQIEYTYTFHGSWELKGDTLVRVQYPECEFSIDKSKISYSKDKEAMMQEMLASWEERVLDSKSRFETGGEQRKAELVSIDASGEKIEVQTIPEEGEQEQTYYIERL